jgi:CRP/FNR family transcriptional regulator, cyclic AMP receptor protein
MSSNGNCRIALSSGSQPGSHIHSVLLGLPREYSDKLLAGAKQFTLEDGGTLFERGDAGDGCYWLQEGTVKVTINSLAGEERILAILGPGAIIGELAMMDGLPRSATVEAMRKCTFSFVPRQAFLRCLEEQPVIYKYLVGTLVQRLRQADEEAAAASFLTVRARVARALLDLAHHLGERTSNKDQILVRHDLRQSDLAGLAGVARESVNRTLSDWRRQNVIAPSPRSTYLIDVAKLEREAKTLE